MSNLVIWVLILSTTIQFAAAYFMLRLIRNTSKSFAWLSMGVAMFFMGVRRTLTLYNLVSNNLTNPPDLSPELISLFISGMFLLGIRSISPLFLSLRHRENVQEDQIRREKLISELGSLALSNPEISKLFKRSVSMIAKAFNVKYSKILKLQEDRQELLLIAGVGWKRGLVGKRLVSALSNSQASYTLQQKDPIIVENLETETRFQGPDLLTSHNIVSGMSVIIGDIGNPYGILSVHSKEYHIFESEDADFLQSIANILGEAIQRRDAEETLKSNQIRYQALFDRVSDAVFIIDLNRTYIAVNQQAATMLGYKVDEIVGMKVEQLIVPNEAEDSKKVHLALRTGKRLPVYERTILSKTGEHIPIEVDVAMVYGPGGEPLHVQSVVRDISQRKIKEKEKELSHAKDQEQLIQAETLAESTLAITSKLNLTEVLDEILHQVNRVVPYDGAQIALLEGKHIRNVQWRGYEIHGGADFITDLVQDYKKLKIDAKVIKSKRPQVIGDTSKYPGWVVGEDTDWVNSYLSVPLIIREEVLGLLRLDGVSINKFTIEDGDRLQKLAYAASIALENAKRYSQSLDEITERKRSEEETLILLKLTKAISEAASFPDAIQVALELVCTHTGWVLGEIWQPSEDGSTLEYQQDCYYALDRKKLHEFIEASKQFDFPSNIGLPGRVWKSKQEEWNKDVSEMPVNKYLRVKHAKKAGIKSSIGIPLIASNNVIAVMVFYSDQAWEKDHRQVDIIKNIANQLGAIFERKQADLDLKKSYATNRALIDALPDGIFRVSKKGIFLDYIASEDLKTFLSFEDAIGSHMNTTMPHEAVNDALKLIQIAINTGETQFLEFSLPIDNLVYYYEARIVDAGDEEVLAFVRDITDQKKAKEDLELLSRAVEQSAGQVIITDNKGEIEYANPAFVSSTGFTIEEILGSTTNIIKSDLHDDEFYKSLWNTITSGEVFAAEFANRKKNGELYYLTKTISPIKDADGKISHFVDTSHDITARKLAEDALERKAKELELLHKVRSAYSREIELSVIYRLVVEEIAASFDYQLVSLYTRAENLLIKQFDVGYPDIFPEVALDTGIIGKVGRTGQPLLIEDVSTDPDYLFSAEEVESEICVPLFDQGAVVGVINIESTAAHKLSNTDLNLLIAIADHVSIAIERARIHAELTENEQRYRALVEVSPEAILVHSAGKFVYANDAAIELLECSSIDEIEGVEVTSIIPADTHQLITERINPDHPLDDSLNQIETTLTTTINSIKHVSLSAGLLRYNDEPATQIIMRDITTRRRRELELEALFAVGEVLRVAYRRDEITTALMNILPIHLDAQAIGIMVHYPDSGLITLENAHGLWSDLIGQHAPFGQKIIDFVMESGKPYFTNDIPSNKLLANKTNLDKLNSIAIVPMKSQEEFIGMLFIGSVSPIDHNDVRMYATIADMSSNALHRANSEDKLETTFVETVLALAKTMDARDTQLATHSKNLAVYAENTLRFLGGSEHELQDIRWGALLHDIGKIAIPDEILRKPGPLTEPEWEIMKRHPSAGAEIIAPIEMLSSVAPIIRTHQEKFDGSGYPMGLKGEEIPLAARVLSVVDAFGAMTEDRVYRKKRELPDVIQELKDCSGSHFDPIVVEAFITVLDNMEQAIEDQA